MIASTKLMALSCATTIMLLGATWRAPARAQDDAQRDAAKAALPESVADIDVQYRKELDEVERRRLERLAVLAGKQAKEEANKTYESYFQVAIAANLFTEAETVADRVLKSNKSSTRVVLLADVVKIMAQVGRGAYDDSLASLSSMLEAAESLKTAQGAAVSHPLPITARLTLLEAFFQRLCQAGQFGALRKAFDQVLERTNDPTIKGFVASRLTRLEMVGKPAPPIAGTDVEGQPLRLADFRGDVVLVVFWASWCPNCAEEVSRLDTVYRTYRDRGFRIVGVNLDGLQEGKSPDTVRLAVREFLLEYNVPWPNVMSGRGDQDFARAYGVSEVPANVLIGRDGTVIQLDLTRSNLEKTIAEAIGR